MLRQNYVTFKRFCLIIFFERVHLEFWSVDKFGKRTTTLFKKITRQINVDCCYRINMYFLRIQIVLFEVGIEVILLVSGQRRRTDK